MLKKILTGNNADLTTMVSAINQIVANSSTQTKSVLSIYKQEHVGLKAVARDIPKYVVMAADATEEIHVATCISMILVIDVMNSHRKSTTVSFNPGTIVNTVLLKKLIQRTFMNLNL